MVKFDSYNFNCTLEDWRTTEINLEDINHRILASSYPTILLLFSYGFGIFMLFLTLSL